MTTGTGKWCAGGETPFNDGQHYQGDGTCALCGRKVRLLKSGAVARHVWQPVNPNVDVGDTSTNSQANRAARAFERTRK